MFKKVFVRVITNVILLLLFVPLIIRSVGMWNKSSSYLDFAFCVYVVAVFSVALIVSNIFISELQHQNIRA